MLKPLFTTLFVLILAACGSDSTALPDASNSAADDESLPLDDNLGGVDVPINNTVRYAYLDDALDLASRPTVSSPAPRIGVFETQGFKAANASYSAYDIVSGKAGTMAAAAAIQAINPEVEVHYAFSLRAYQGFNQSDPSQPANGLTFAATGPATANDEVYAGHWLYLQGSTLLSAMDNATLSVQVAHPERFDVGEYVVIYDAPAGSFTNPEHLQVQAVSGDVLSFSARGYKSTASAHASGSIIAQHALGVGGGDARNWGYNQSTACPLDSQGRSMSEACVNWVKLNIGRKNNGQPSGARISGLYFDADVWQLGRSVDRLDPDNDLEVEYAAIDADGVNLWGEGLELAYAQFREAFPDLLLAGGMNTSRGFKTLNGIQHEAAFYGGNYEPRIPEYGHDGAISDGYDAHFQRYILHQNYHETENGYQQALAKFDTALYPIRNPGDPPPSNAPFRLAFATTLLGDGYFGQQNSNTSPNTWYDEYAVDVQPGSPEYGQAQILDDVDNLAARQHKNWLGQALGKFQRLYDAELFAAANNLLSNGDFNLGEQGWEFGNVEHFVDTAESVSAGGQALKMNGHSVFTAITGDAYIRSPEVELEAGQSYTVTVAVKAADFRDFFLRLQTARGRYTIAPGWSRIVHTFVADSSTKARIEFNVGGENTAFWIDEVMVFKGNANVFRRDYENGIVVVNATPEPRTIDLGGTFQRIKGSGQDAVNDGSSIQQVTLPPYDAAILVRPEH